MLKNRKNGRKGFTLIELLVVVLILAILMAVALPLYLKSVGDSQLKTCRSNMQTIANAVQAKRVQDGVGGVYFNGPVTVAGLPDLQQVPVCPVTGTNTYAVDNTTPAGSFTVSCTNHAGADFTPGGH